MGALKVLYADAESNVVESLDSEDNVAKGNDPLVQELVGDLVPEPQPFAIRFFDLLECEEGKAR